MGSRRNILGRTGTRNKGTPNYSQVPQFAAGRRRHRPQRYLSRTERSDRDRGQEGWARPVSNDPPPPPYQRRCRALKPRPSRRGYSARLVYLHPTAKVHVPRGVTGDVRGKLAVDSVFATTLSRNQKVSRPRRPTQNNQITRYPSQGTSIGSVALPLPSVRNLRFPTIRIDGSNIGTSGSPALLDGEDVTNKTAKSLSLYVPSCHRAASSPSA